jgi:uncharacterized protein (TIGR03546 family)
MLLWILRPLRLMAHALYETCSPRQIALGVALGMMIGLLPKDNLTALSLTVILFAFKFNLPAGLLSILAFSWVGVALDPLAHRTGDWVLHQSTLELAWAWIFQLPLMPWTAMNNTVVAGQFLFGLALMAPVYYAAKAAADRWLEPASQWVTSHRLYQILFGADVASSWRTG